MVTVFVPAVLTVVSDTTSDHTSVSSIVVISHAWYWYFKLRRRTYKTNNINLLASLSGSFCAIEIYLHSDKPLRFMKFRKQLVLAMKSTFESFFSPYLVISSCFIFVFFIIISRILQVFHWWASWCLLVFFAQPRGAYSPEVIMWQ